MKSDLVRNRFLGDATMMKQIGGLIFLAVCLLVSSAAYLYATENDDIRDVAERFVRQVVERDTDAVLQSYPMTDAFRAGMPNADTVIEWARGIDQLFGRLGEVNNSEIVEHPNLGLRSVYLYYQGTKRPAKIWVTFSETTIDGFHCNVWKEGYAERKPATMFENMSVTESLIWGCVLIPMIVMSLFLLNGKGAFLIAGYNTMPKEEQAKYDAKALCRSTGWFLLWTIFWIMLVPFGIHGENTGMLYCTVGIITVSTLAFVIYANTGNRFRKKEDREKKPDERSLDRILCSRSVQWIVGVLLVGSVLVIPALLLFGEKEPIVKITDNGVRIRGMYGVKMDYAEIIDISLIDNTINSIGLTRKTHGYSTPTSQKGYFQSNKYGKVLLFTRASASPTIHIERNGKPDVFLNLSNDEATRILYNDLKTAFAK